MCWEGFPGRENSTCKGARCGGKVGDGFVYLTTSPLQILCLYWGQGRLELQLGTEASRVLPKGEGKQEQMPGKIFLESLNVSLKPGR